MSTPANAEKASDTTPPSPSRRTRRGSSFGGPRHRFWPDRPLRIVLTSLGPSSVIIGLLASLAMLLRMFFPVPIGVADNGKGQTNACQLGLVPATDGPRYWSFAIFDWIKDPLGTACEGAPSSEVLLLEIASWLTTLFGGVDGALNLRFVMVGYALLCGVLIGLFAFASRRNLGVRIVVSVLLFGVLADVAFAGYAGGVFGEYAGLLGIAIMSVAGIYLGASGACQWWGLASFAGGAVLTITATTQAIVLLVPIAVVLVCTTIRSREGRGTRVLTGRERLKRTALGKIMPVAVALALALPAAWMSQGFDEDAQAIDRWELISVGILGHSNAPEVELVEMGFSEGVVPYIGESVWGEGSIIGSPEWETNKHLMSYGTAARFLLAHPDRAFAIANDAAGVWLKTRPSDLGSYERSEGIVDGQQDYSFIADVGGKSLATFGVTPLLLMWAALIAGAIVLIRRSDAGSLRRGHSITVLMLVAFAIAQYFTVAFGTAADSAGDFVYGIFAQVVAAVVLLAGYAASHES